MSELFVKTRSQERALIPEYETTSFRRPISERALLHIVKCVLTPKCIAYGFP